MRSFLYDYSEKELIGEILSKQGGKPPSFIGVPDGDDCSAFSFPSGLSILSTIDPFNEGVHFLPEYIAGAGIILGEKNPEKYIGRKALAINISDILSMGGIPKMAFISLSLPKKTKKSFFDGILKGFLEIVKEYGIYLAGGDLAENKTGINIVSLVNGTVPRGREIQRKGAKPGDRVYISAPHGASSFGLEILRGKYRETPVKYKRRFVLAHINPIPDSEASARIFRDRLASAMTDSSDGLYRSLEIICGASDCGMEIDLGSLPAPEGLKLYAARKWQEYSLYGGEDYALVFSSGKKKLTHFIEIGRVTVEKGIRFYHNGIETKKLSQKKGFDHFSVEKT